MKITDVNFPSDENNLGLQSIEMSRLGELVVIAGQNGAGKSRLLECIQKKLSLKPSKRKKKQILKEIEYNKSLIDMVRNQGSYDPETDDKYIQENYQKIEENNKILLSSFLTTDIEANDHYVCLNFKPQSIALVDPYTLAINERDLHASKMDDLNNEAWEKGVLSKIQYIQDKWWDANHQLSEINSYEKKKIDQDYEQLRVYIKDFFGVDLKREKGQATLFGFPLGQTNLSDGQKILLQLCIALYSLETKFENIILFIDEPENSLHPNILLDTIDKIRLVLKNGQIWIATHSVSLLAHVDPLSIWYMDNGSVSYAGKIPEKVLEGLIGDEERISELTDFLSLPAQLATTQYAYECLQSPQSVLTDKNDPQIQQIYDYLTTNRPLSLLDFGAGKCRLITTLSELDRDRGVNTIETLDYNAYEIDIDNIKICKSNIESVYTDDKKRFYFSETDLRDHLIKNSCNIVLMTNVFHEVEPSEWINTMTLVDYCLASGGYLIIIEDQIIPKGEKAYKEGFIVFDKAEFKILFGLDDYISTIHSSNDRLKVHFIPKHALKNITSDTRKMALESHIARSKREINNLRNGQASYRNGKMHAFWTQQFTNANLALEA